MQSLETFNASNLVQTVAGVSSPSCDQSIVMQSYTFASFQNFDGSSCECGHAAPQDPCVPLPSSLQLPSDFLLSKLPKSCHIANLRNRQHVHIANQRFTVNAIVSNAPSDRKSASSTPGGVLPSIPWHANDLLGFLDIHLCSQRHLDSRLHRLIVHLDCVLHRSRDNFLVHSRSPLCS
jgi:hypothetical protein